MTLPSYAMNQASFPEMYERWLARPLFRPFAEATLDMLDLASGDRVLDLASGTGVIARLAAERVGDSGTVVGIDLSPGMLAVARTVAPAIDWREGNAADPPLKEGEDFDVVVCQQGFQFFQDKPAAARAMRRALRPGGRLAVSTWRPIEEAPFMRDFHRIAQRLLGAFVDQRHGFGEAGPLAEVLREAGLTDVAVKTMSLPVRFDDPPVFVRLNAMALVGMSPASKTMSDEERAQAVDQLVAEGAGVVPSYTNGADLVFDLATNVATARA